MNRIFKVDATGLEYEYLDIKVSSSSGIIIVLGIAPTTGKISHFTSAEITFVLKDGNKAGS